MAIENVLKVLAVADPAVLAYTDPKYAIVDSFTNNNKVTVDFNIVSFDKYYETMMAVFAGKEHYDIVMVAGHLWLKDFVNQGFLTEVKYPTSKEYDREDIIEVITREMLVNGNPYLYPSFCDGHILLYRKSVVEKVLGNPLPKGVDTDTVLSLASRCDHVDNMRGIAMKAHSSEIFLDFLPYLRNEGVDAFDLVNHTPTFNNEKGVKALEKYLSLKNFAPENTHTFGNDEVREAFQQKEVALAITWGGQLGVVLDNRCIDVHDVGFAAIKTAWNVTWSFAISNRSTNKELANQFLAYLTSANIDRVIGGYAGSPVRRTTYLTDSQKYNWYDVHLKLIEEYAKPLPMMDKAGEKTTPLYEQIYDAFTGEKSAADALKEAENRVLEIDRRRS